MLTIDVSDVMRAAAELGAKGAAAVDAIEPVMERGALNIKNEMRALFEGSRHFARVGRSVSYERVGLLTSSLAYEIGPTIGGAGSLAGVAVEGGANGGGGTVDILPALEHEVPRLAAEIQIALGLL